MGMIFTWYVRNHMIFYCIKKDSSSLISLLSNTDLTTASAETVTGFVVELFTISYSSLSCKISTILAFHGLKFVATSNLSSILRPTAMTARNFKNLFYSTTLVSLISPSLKFISVCNFQPSTQLWYHENFQNPNPVSVLVHHCLMPKPQR